MIAHSAVARNARNILSPQLLGILAHCTDFALGKITKSHSVVGPFQPMGSQTLLNLFGFFFSPNNRHLENDHI